ncbi:hypothetical protein GVAV_000216 [Gurleya vavrai]
MFFFLFTTISADNFILSKDLFDTLIISEYRFESKFLKSNQAIQISFPGVFYYQLKKSDRNFELVDSTVYLCKRPKNFKIYLTIENMKYGLIEEAWKMIFFLVGLFVVGLIPYLILL